MIARAQEIRAGLARLHAADPVLAQLIDDRKRARAQMRSGVAET